MYILFLSRQFLRVFRGCVHRNALTEKAWKNAVRTVGTSASTVRFELLATLITED